jgi:hypothetical protein
MFYCANRVIKRSLAKYAPRSRGRTDTPRDGVPTTMADHAKSMSCTRIRKLNGIGRFRLPLAGTTAESPIRLSTHRPLLLFRGGLATEGEAHAAFTNALGDAPSSKPRQLWSGPWDARIPAGPVATM